MSFTPRGAAVATFLTHLDAVVQREVSAASTDTAGAGRWEFEAERIAAEVAGSLALLRTELQRHRGTASGPLVALAE